MLFQPKKKLLLKNSHPSKNKNTQQHSTTENHFDNSYRHHSGHERRRASANIGLNEMAGEVINQTVVLSTNISAWRQVSGFNPPLR